MTFVIGKIKCTIYTMSLTLIICLRSSLTRHLKPDQRINNLYHDVRKDGYIYNLTSAQVAKAEQARIMIKHN